MRKIISIIIMFSTLLLSISSCLPAVAKCIYDYRYKETSNELQSFAKNVYSLTSKYDFDLGNSHNSSETSEVINFMSSAPFEDEHEINYECFETNRLIVFSDEEFDSCGAIEHLSGYNDMHLLQYDNLEATIDAYEYYCDNEIINLVEPDVIVTLEEFEEESNNPNYIDYPHDTSITPSWGYERIQSYDAFQYILQHKALNDLPEIVVGIIDSGIWTGNKYFDERLICAYSFIGKDPYSDTSGHGSKVAGVILENTLPNVKIISYQVFQNGESTASLIRLAEAQAELDEVDIVNSSYSQQHPNSEIINHNFTDIQNTGYLQVAGAGNDSNTILHTPASSSNVISVASLMNNDKLANYSSRGQWVDVAAPGDNITIPSTKIEGAVNSFNGTSCATPFVVSVCAMIMTQYPTFSNSHVAEVLFKSCEKSDVNVYHGIVNMFKAVTFYDSNTRQTAMPQFSLESKPTDNQFYSETQYVELSCSDNDAKIYYTLDKSIPSQSNGTLYTEPIEISTTTTIYAVAYTNEYFKSEVAKRTFLIRFPLSEYPNENGWHIRDNGMIWGYSGSNMDLVVPETVLGVNVKGIESEAFSEQAYIKSITMPQCLTTIEEKAFYKCNSLTSLIAPGVTDIGVSAFHGCSNLNEVFLPNLQTIGKGAFRVTGSIEGFPFENLKKVPANAFWGSDVYRVNLDNATSIQGSAFAYCTSLTEVSIPKIETEINMGSAVFRDCTMLEKVVFNENTIYIPEHTFNGCNFSSLDCFDTIETIDNYAFSNNDALTDITMKSVDYIGSSAFENCQNLTTVVFPNIEYIDYEAFKDCSSLTSLTLSNCVSEIGSDAFNGCDSLKYLLVNGEMRLYGNVFAGSSVERLEMNGVGLADSLPIVENSIIAMPSTFYECSENTKGRNYKVYGTSGTYAKKWANENGHTFINISQDTAILEDVPMEYTGNGEILSPDVIGFNKTYQWYSNTEPNNTTGTPIEGATNKDFNPADYPKSLYYYCVITSTDKGYDPIEIRTGITENKTVHIHTEEEIPAVAPTCTETGLTAGVKCSECGEIITEQQKIPAIGHNYSSVVIAPTCTEQGYTTYTCECGESYIDDYIDSTGHSYTSEITTSATHTTIGVITFTCACGDTYTETIDKLAEHNHNAVITAPTCTERGYTTYTCECGDSYVDDYVDALGHTPSTAVEENYVAPICTENGSKDVVIYCSVCDEEISRETVTLDATGHSYTTAVTAPTCTEQGYTTYTCSCGDNYVDDYVNATGHADNDGDGYCDADNELLDPSVDCDHICHKDGILGFIWRIINVFNMLFGLHKTCSCDVTHY